MTITTQLMPQTELRVWDNSGNLATGAKIYTYSAGTSTPLPTYTDSTGGTTNANPVIANSRGECSVWLDTTKMYKIVAYDAVGNPLWSQDNIGNLSGGTNGAQYVYYTHTATNSVTRTVSSRLSDDIPSLRDFGAVGAPINDNGAFVLAEASNALQIYVPPGNWICQDSGALTKAYIGPGTITGVASVIVPGNYDKRSTALSPIPQQGGGNYWAGDTSHSRQRYSVLGNVKSGLTFPYFCAQETPWFEIFDNHAGSSGVVSLVSSPITAGDLTTVVNSTSGLSVGQIVGILNPITGAVDQTLTIGSMTPTSLGFGGTAITNSYAVGTRITPTLRTMTPSHHYELTNYGAGDSYILMMRLTAAYSPLAGQEHFYYTSTTGYGGGDISAARDGNYLSGWEFQFIDNGYDTAVIGDVRDYDRTNNTAALYQVWIDRFSQSYGSKPMDAGYVLAGKYNCGIDLSRADFAGNGNNAIGLGTNQRIYWGNTVTPNPVGLPDQLWGNNNSANWDDWTGSQRRFVIGSNPTLTLSSVAAQFTGFVQTTEYYGVDGVQVVGNQITGYGSPTGASKLANFPGASATLAQTSAQLAQLIVDLKTHGLLGA